MLQPGNGQFYSRAKDPRVVAGQPESRPWNNWNYAPIMVSFQFLFDPVDRGRSVLSAADICLTATNRARRSDARRLSFARDTGISFA